MKTPQQSNRHVISTPQNNQKALSKSISTFQYSPLTNCTNLPVAQPLHPFTSQKTRCLKEKEGENGLHSNSLQKIIMEQINSGQVRLKMSTDKPMQTNGSITSSQTNPTISSLNYSESYKNHTPYLFYDNKAEPSSTSNGFETSTLKEMQMKFKRLLEENERLKLKLIQKENANEEKNFNQHCSQKQIHDLESENVQLNEEINRLKSQAETFSEQNQKNIKTLQETEEKILSMAKNIENQKSSNKFLTLENISLRKKQEETSITLSQLQTQISQSAAKIQQYEENCAKMLQDQDNIISSWTNKYSELQQSSILEKNLHQQSEKALKSKIQNLESELTNWTNRVSENAEIIMQLKKELNNEKEISQILNFKFEEASAELKQLKNKQTQTNSIKEDNEKLYELVAKLKSNISLYEKEVVRANGECERLNQELEVKKNIFTKANEELELYKGIVYELEQKKEFLERENCSQKNEIQELVRLNSEWESKINKLIQENEKLSEILQEKETQLQKSQENYTNLETIFKNLQKENHLCTGELVAVQKSKVESLKKIQDFEQVLSNERLIRQQLENDKKAIIHFYEDIRMRQEKEIEQQKTKNSNVMQELENCKKRFEEYKLLKVNDQEIRANAEKSVLESELVQIKNKTIEYEIGYNALIRKNEDLTTKLAQTNQEKEAVLFELNEKTEIFEKDRQNLKEVLEEIRSNLFDKEEMVLKLEVARKKNENQIKELKEIIQISKEETEKLYAINSRKNMGNEGLQSEISKINRENIVLCKENKDLKKCLLKAKEEERNNHKTIEILTNTTNEYKLQIEQFTQQFNDKNQQFIEKMEDLDRIKEDYSRALGKMQDLECNLLEKLHIENK